MRIPDFQSAMAVTIRAVVEFRQSLGYGDRGVVSLLGNFDRYLVAQGLTTPVLTRELVEDWVASAGPLKPSSRGHRLHVLRLLGRYMARTHPETYIPGPAW